MATITLENIIYTLNNDNNTASVTGNTFPQNSNIIIPENIVYSEISYTVTSISQSAFRNDNEVLSIIIGDAVTSIVDEAFSTCGSLTSVTIGNAVTSIGLKAFFNCTRLTSITIPDAVTSIGTNAFTGTNLVTVTIGTSLTSISMFSSLSSITTMTISYGNNSLINGSSGEVYEISSSNASVVWSPRNVTSITILDSVTMTNGISYPVTTIGASVFKTRTNLVSVVIPDSVTQISNAAFSECTTLSTVTIGTGLTTMGVGAFSNCGANLTSIYFLGNKPTTISMIAFESSPNVILYYVFGALNWPAMVASRSTQVITTSTTGIASITNFSNSSKTATFLIEDATYTNIELVIVNGSSGVTSGRTFTLSDTTWTVTSPSLSNGDEVKVFIQTSSGATTVTGLLEYTTDGTNYSVDLGVGIISIGTSAFSNCINLSYVVIPDSVTSLDSYAFSNCTNLSSVVIPGSVTSLGSYAFYYCRNISSITIPDSVTSLGTHVFQYCSNMTSITIPYSVTSLSNYMFQYCANLRSITIPDSVTSLGNYTFYGCEYLSSITIPDSVTELGESVFKFCTRLTSITIPDSVTSIGGSAFYSCENLTSITIPDSVTSIGSQAFISCTSLTTVTIGNGVTSIGISAFFSCGNLATVTIGDSLTSILEFSSLSSITTMTISLENTTLINGSSGEVYQVSSPVASIVWSPRNVTSMTIASSITTTNNITYPVTSISQYAFLNCTNLSYVVIPDSVTSIDQYAFLNCTNLTTVIIGTGVTSMGSSVFTDCTNLTSVYFLGNKPTSGMANSDTDLFNNCPNVTLYYIADALNWSASVVGKSSYPITTSATGLASITIFSNSSKTATFSIEDASYMNVELVIVNGSSGVTSGKAFTLSNTRWTVTSPSLSNGDEIKVFIQTSSGATTVTGLLEYTTDGTNYSVDLGVGIISIGTDAFLFCRNLSSVTIGNGVTSIGTNAFLYCSNLSSVTIGNGVTSIGTNAFSYCSNLSSVTIGNGVTSIGTNAFSTCTNLATVTIGDSLTSVSEFLNSSSLNTMTISSENTSLITGSSGEVYEISSPNASIVWSPRNVTSITIADSVLSNNITYPVTTIGVLAFDSCTNLSSIVIPDSVTTIGDTAFNGCTNLSSIVIPDSVTTIGDTAFNGCTNLSSIVIPDSVTTISDFAFNGCTNLTSVIIGTGVTNMGYGAFSNCDNLTGIYFLGDKPTSGMEDRDTYLFYNSTNVILYYVVGASNWFSIIAGKPAYSIPTITATTSSIVTISSDPSLTTIYLYTSTDNGVTWTSNTVSMTNGLGTFDISTFTETLLVSTIANFYDVVNDSDYYTQIIITPIPSGNVCFPAKTPVLTDHGYINIEAIDPRIHTIRKEKIVTITRTICRDSHLVRIAKNALGNNYPEKTTYISKNHKVLFRDQMIEAKHLVDNEKVTLVQYKGQVLYNVLLERRSMMKVNNLIVETLHPENKVAILYRLLKTVAQENHDKLIELFNNGYGGKLIELFNKTCREKRPILFYTGIDLSN